MSGPSMLLPPAPGRCQTCAVAHRPEEPHNRQSFFYQMAFYQQEGRSVLPGEPGSLSLASCQPHAGAWDGTDPQP